MCNEAVIKPDEGEMRWIKPEEGNDLDEAKALTESEYINVAFKSINL